MISALGSLEKNLQDAFKGAPRLPDNGKKALVEWTPWINLIFGLLALLSAYWLWQWAHVANGLINYANSISQAYGGGTVPNRLGLTVWLALIVLAAQGAVMLAAFSPLKDRKKAGWDLLFYGVLLNLAYGVVVAFTSYGGGHLVSSLIGAVVGLYLLFQIRDSYTGKTSPTKPAK